MTNDVGVIVAGDDDELTAARIGFRVETLRMGAGLSVPELALRLGMTPDELDELESGLRLPSIGTLFSIARAFRTQPGELLPSAGVSPRVGVHLPVSEDPAASTARIIDGGPDNPTRTYLFELRAGEGNGNGLARHPGDELLVVLEGDVVRFAEGITDEVVHAGESRVIDTSVRHGIRATETGPARFLLVSTDAPCDLA